jgi:hypothetical protein
MDFQKRRENRTATEAQMKTTTTPKNRKRMNEGKSSAKCRERMDMQSVQ